MQTGSTRMLFKGMLLTGMLMLASPALATVYKCTENNQTTYSSEPCGRKPQEVQAPISVTPAFVPPDEKSSSGGGGGGGVLNRIGLGSADVVTILLFALIPLSFMAMFVFSRKSRNLK